MHHLATALIRYRLVLLALATAVTLAAFPYSIKTQFDRSVRSFFDDDNPRYQLYEKIQRQFDGDTLCLAVYTDEQLLTRDGIARLEEFSQQLSELEGVLRAQSLASMPRPGGRPGTIGKLFASPRTDVDKLRQEILDTELFANQFVSDDGKTGVVLVLVDPKAIESGVFEQSLPKMRNLCQSRGGHIVGATVMINDVYDNLEQDSWILTNVSTWAMVGVILSLFRRLRWMILPLAVVQASLIWIKALMYLLDIQLSLTGAMTTAMVTVVAITSSIHLAVRFREICFEQPDHVKSLHQTLVHTLPPIFWSCATTAVGFGSLAISQVAPVRAFGIAMASASMLVFVAVCVIMPGGTLLARGWLGVVPRPSFGEKQLADGLHGAARFVGRHAWLTTAATLAVLALAGVGAARLGIETDFTRNFKESSQILQGYRFVEGRLGGAGLIDVVVDAPADLHDEFLNRVRTCQSQLRTIAGVTKVTSLVDMLDLLKAGRMMIGVVRTAPPPELRQFWNPEQRRLRIVLRVTEQQTTAGKEQLMSRIDEVVHASFEPPTAVTGLYVLLVYLIDSLLEDQWSSLAISSVGIFVMMLIAFGDVRLAVVAFLPNIIPIVTTLGVMGWVDLKINVATAMIQSISMGMAVDFSIHYLYRYRHERRNGLEFYPSVSATHRQTGQAMVFADGALILGFGILTLSHFLPTIQFGMLVSLAMVGGLVGNLIMLPILLRVLFGIGPPPADSPARANIPVADLV